MRIMLVACLLLVLAVARAQPNFLTCSQLCISGIDPSKWQKNCDCLDEVASGVRSLHIDQLDDKGIYYEPTDLYLRHLPFLNPPFYIINPTVKLKMEVTDPKLNIREPKTQNLNYKDPQTFVTSRRINNIVNNNEVSLKPTNIHNMDVSSEKVTGVKRLKKKEISDCIELHNAISHYDYSTLKNNNDDSTRIGQKCNDSVGTLKQKPKDIRSKSKELFKEKYSTEQGLFTTTELERANSSDISINNTQNLDSKDKTKEPEKFKQNLKESYKNIVYLSTNEISIGKEHVKNLFTQDATIPSNGLNILTEIRKTDKHSSTVDTQDSLYSTFKRNNFSAKINNNKLSKRPQKVSVTNLRNSHGLFSSVEIVDLQITPFEKIDVFKTNNMHLLRNSKGIDNVSLKQISRESVKFGENHLKEKEIPGNRKNNKLLLSNAEDFTTQQDMYNSNKLISNQSAISRKKSYAKDDNIDKDIDKLKLFDDVTTAPTSNTSIVSVSELVNKDINPQPIVLTNGNNIKPNDSYLMNGHLEIITKEENGTLRGEVENDSSTVSERKKKFFYIYHNENTNPDTRSISKIMTREFENGTVVSSIYGSHISEARNTSPRDFATLNYMKLVQPEMKEEFLKGNMYFMFNNVHIPARFKQNENGDISVGIDGPAICSKLSFAVKSLINTICSEISNN